MITTSRGRISFLVALALLAAAFATPANAQCCGAPATAFYQPTAVTAYSPVTTSGWYPGYWLHRISARLFGSPSTYVAAYPTTAYYAGYTPAYTAAYRPAYTVGYATTSYAAPMSYAAAPMSYAAPAAACPTCPSYSASYAPVQQVTVQPACPSGCAPCAAGASYAAQPAYAGQSGSYAAQPASYGTSAGSAPCCQPGTAGAPPTTYTAPSTPGPAPTPALQRTFEPQNAAPSLDPMTRVPERQQDTQRPTTNGANDAQQPIQPEPAEEYGDDPYKVEDDSSTYFQAPKLFDPSDRTAQRSIAPVMTAVYEKPGASSNSTFVQPISLQQAHLDAIGWVSASD